MTEVNFPDREKNLDIYAAKQKNEEVCLKKLKEQQKSLAKDIYIQNNIRQMIYCLKE